MNKYFLIIGLAIVAGCANETAVKSESVRWVSIGTLVSVSPDTEPTRDPDRLRSAVLGETQFGRTRVETTDRVYIISGKIGLA